MHNTASEILINAFQVTRYKMGDTFEFVLDQYLQVIECVKIQSPKLGIIRPIPDSTTLKGMLFELNHVRVNPKLDNNLIIESLTKALTDIGVTIFNQPSQNSMALCYKPLGEISDSVRFYLNEEEKPVFLSPAMRPKVVYSNKF